MLHHLHKPHVCWTNCRQITLVAMFPNLKSFVVALCLLTMTCLVEAQLPTLSISSVPPGILRFSWPSNFTTANWQLVSTTNLAPANWQPIPLAPFPSNNVLVVSLPITDSRRYFQLRTIGAGSCVFQATPQVINSGESSTLTWCPLAGYTYRLSHGPGPGGGAGGVVTGGTLTVSPTNTTVYTLTASNALGAVTADTTTVICNPCGWLQVTDLIASVGIEYDFSTSTPSYNFSIFQIGAFTFHLHLQSATATDAYLLGFSTDEPVFGVPLDEGYIRDREDDKTGPQTFTTTQFTGGLVPSLHDVSIVILHLTCNSYDFSYNIIVNTTEITPSGTYAVSDGVGTGAIATRPLPITDNRISGIEYILATYPPTSGDYFTPSSHVGEEPFKTGTVTAPNAGKALISWSIYPPPPP
jgi:hypothetical protein